MKSDFTIIGNKGWENQQFPFDVRKLSYTIDSLPEWTEFSWVGDTVGKYILMEAIAEKIVEKWADNKNEFGEILELVEKYLVSGDEEIQNLFHTDFFPSIINCEQKTIRGEIYNSLGSKSKISFDEINKN